MQINVHLSAGDKTTTSVVTFVNGSNGPFCAIEFFIKGGRVEDNVQFFLPAVDHDKAKELAALWNSLSIAKLQP